MSYIEQCPDCILRSEERSAQWGFAVHTLCDQCREDAVALYQRHPLPGKKGNHLGQAGK